MNKETLITDGPVTFTPIECYTRDEIVKAFQEKFIDFTGYTLLSNRDMELAERMADHLIYFIEKARLHAR